jgi:hypothetical protein
MIDDSMVEGLENRTSADIPRHTCGPSWPNGKLANPEGTLD